MSIERRILVELRKQLKEGANESTERRENFNIVLHKMDEIEREIVNADDIKNKDNALNALTSAFSNPDVLKSLLEG